MTSRLLQETLEENRQLKLRMMRINALNDDPGRYSQELDELSKVPGHEYEVHSEEYFIMFLGYLVAATPELHHITPTQLLDTWRRYKGEMKAANVQDDMEKKSHE